MIAVFSAVALLALLSHAQDAQPKRGEPGGYDGASGNARPLGERIGERKAVGDTRRWAVICVGLPGDAEHEEAFRDTANQIQAWLVQSLQFPAGQVLRLPAQEREPTQVDARANPVNSAASPLTAERLRAALSEVNSRLMPEDSLWIITLGHGNYDGRQAWFHLAGKDPTPEDFGKWLVDVRCREQVVWLTHSSSGWFVKPLSRPGRIVISATAADDESNETEFPHALAAVIQRPQPALDTDQDGTLSVAELLNAVVKEVDRRFKSDKRLPTEHAQLDDNGDGMGTEVFVQQEFEVPVVDAAALSKKKAAWRSRRALGLDGRQARATSVPLSTPTGISLPEQPFHEASEDDKSEPISPQK